MTDNESTIFIYKTKLLRSDQSILVTEETCPVSHHTLCVYNHDYLIMPIQEAKRINLS